MRRPLMWFAVSLIVVAAGSAGAETDAAAAATSGAATDKAAHHDDSAAELKPEEHGSEGTVTVGGKLISYHAVVGTLVVPPKDAQPEDPEPPAGGGKAEPARAAMSYVAYFKHADRNETRPITFLYNGGPGSSTVWLHMGAFGPRRIVTSDDTHTPAAPYALIDNQYSLLDASDLVFVDAPGTGFGRIAGKDREKAFWGIDGDADAFAAFITEFLSKYGRWNSPKYLFGESYGTTRSALLARVLQRDNYAVDLNGIILLSQILCFDSSADGPQYNPGVDLPYELALPTYAATAWYHHRLSNAPKDLAPFLTEVENFATSDYAAALMAGNALDPARRQAIAERLQAYTGLPAAYWLKADLRVNGGEFEKTLLQDGDQTTGRLDTRFAGPTMDPLSEESDYDPQSAAISAPYVSAFNDYVRRDLGFGSDRTFKPLISIEQKWDFIHHPEGAAPAPLFANVMPDLAAAMKYNPNLKIQLNAGYFDLATPFYEGIYEMQHLPIPPSLQSNIEFRFYESGHMVYAHEASLKALHDNVAGFIRRTDNVPNS